MTVSSVIAPLIKRRVFRTEEEAVQELLQDYVWRQIKSLQQDVGRFEKQYGMTFQQFSDYLRERSALLAQGKLSQEQRQTLSQVIMLEEDDWLEWKAAQEMLGNWLGVRQEVQA